MADGSRAGLNVTDSEAGEDSWERGADGMCALGVAHLQLKARGVGDDSPAAFRRYDLRVVTVYAKSVKW